MKILITGASGFVGSKLKEKGWNPPMDLEQSMQKYINWTLNNE